MAPNTCISIKVPISVRNPYSKHGAYHGNDAIRSEYGVARMAAIGIA